MSNRATYELTIARKLDEIPLPDLADAIWARIEHQLDQDMPDDNGGNGTGGPSVPGGRTGWIPGVSGFALLLVVACFFFVFRNDPSRQILHQEMVQPSPVQPFTQETTTPELPLVNDKEASTISAEAPVVPPAPDSTTSRPDTISLQSFVPAVPDSAATVIIQTPAPATADSVSVKGKPKTRGVTGISPGDYRIVPARKDSL